MYVVWVAQPAVWAAQPAVWAAQPPVEVYLDCYLAPALTELGTAQAQSVLFFITVALLSLFLFKINVD